MCFELDFRTLLTTQAKGLTDNSPVLKGDELNVCNDCLQRNPL